MLGLITTKRSQLEAAQDIEGRMAEAGHYIPMERLGISPQCGFSSSIVGNTISSEAERQKLELVVQVAKALWG